MIRRLFTVASALSLLLCVTAAVLWVRSYWVEDSCFRVKDFPPDIQRFSLICTVNGKLLVAFSRVKGYPPGTTDWLWAHEVPSRFRHGLTALNRAGFEWHAESLQGGSGSASRIVFPLWAVVLLAGVMPFSWFHFSRRMAHRIRQGHCLTCGYDLRASKDCCPECGTPIPSKVEPTT
jgi:hypothetical protein